MDQESCRWKKGSHSKKGKRGEEEVSVAWTRKIGGNVEMHRYADGDSELLLSVSQNRVFSHVYHYFTISENSNSYIAPNCDSLLLLPLQRL